MKLVPLIILLACAFALLQWVWIPAMRRRLGSQSWSARIGQAGVIAALCFLRNFSAIGAIVLSSAWIATAIARFTGGIAVRDFDARINALNNWKAAFATINETGAYISVVALLCILAFSMYRGGKISWRNRQQARFASELERLKREHEAGDWPHLPSTPGMLEIEQQIAQIEESAESLGDEFRKQVEAISAALKQAWIERDFVRRMNLDIEDESEPDQFRGWRHTVALFFCSKGFLTTLEGSQKWIARAGTALLFVGLLGIGSATIGDGLADEVVQLDRVRVELAKKAAEESRRTRHAAQRPATPPLSADDQTRVTQITRIFNRTFARAMCPPRSHMLVRAAIQKEIVSADHQKRFEIAARPVSEQSVVAVHRDGLRTSQKEKSGDEMADNISRRFHEEAKFEAQRNAGERWEKIKAKVTEYFASFQTPSDFDDIHSAIAREVIGRAIDAVPGDFDSEFAKLAVKTAKKFGTKSLESAYTILSETFLDKLEGEASIAEAVTATVESHFAAKEDRNDWRDFIEDKAALERLVPVEQTPAGDRYEELPSFRDKSLAHLDEERLKAVLDKTRNSLPQAFRDEIDIADGLSTYDSRFPPYFKAENDTLSHRLDTRLQRRDVAITQSKASFERAHSFEQLNGSPDVGGVLLGRDPESGSVHLTDITWTTSGESLRLILHSDTRQYDLGLFPKDLIHRALAYVSDGRPCTVTMVSVEPTREHRVLLHPALLDTRTGLYAIALDSVAFDLIEADSSARDWWRANEQDIDGQGALYQLAYTIRIQTLVRRSSRKLTGEVIDFLNELEKIRKQLAASSATEAARRIAHDEPSNSLKFLQRKSDFFDAKLVEEIRATAHSSASMDHFCELIGRQIDEDNPMLTEENWNSWLRWPPPTFSWVSGVRELPFEIDKSMEFLRLRGPENPLWPLEFTLQVAFRSTPIFAESTTKEVASFDRAPWIVADSGKKIGELVKAHVERNAEARKAFEKMQLFAVLQRVFRCALTGKLGTEFPVSKLITLAAASGSDDHAVTPRWSEAWLSKVLQRKQALTEMNIPDAAMDRARTEALPIFEKCLQLAQRRGDQDESEVRRQLDELSAAYNRWVELRDTSAAGTQALEKLSEITYGLVNLLKYRDLRAALRIDSDSSNARGNTVDAAATPSAVR